MKIEFGIKTKIALILTSPIFAGISVACLLNDKPTAGAYAAISALTSACLTVEGVLQGRELKELKQQASALVQKPPEENSTDENVPG